jgi:hypothetical protein
MSIEVMSFILGGLLVAVGLLGGGIEVRDLKVPPVGRAARVLSFCGGVAFVVLAMFVGRHVSDPSASVKSVTSQDRHTFSEPVYGELRLDACYEWGQRCGEEPATEWCKTQGFKRAVDFPTENVGNRGIRTKLIGTQAECKEPFCVSFKYITCER